MNDPARDSHAGWDELVAAHALHGLEPEDAQRLLAHVDACPTCRTELDVLTLVAAQLGSLGDEEAEAPGWSSLRSGVAPVVPRRRRLASRTLAVAAGVTIVVAAGVVVGGQKTHRPSAPATSAAVTACRQQSGCQVIELHGQERDGAAVLVEAGHASLVPVAMLAAPPGRMYVLWQLPRDGSPTPVVTFRDAERQTANVPLVTGYADTAAFAVSLEDAHAMPTRPTDVLAVGAATS